MFSLYVTPKEVFHAFSHHTDTEHHIFDTQGLHIDAEHHHCELLKLDQQFTAAQIDLPYFDFERLPQYLDLPNIAFYTSYKSQDDFNCHFLRGPPNV
jgi:hypothetical protein